MTFFIPSMSGFAYKPTSNEPQLYLLDLIANLGYTVDDAFAVRKLKGDQIYAGLISTPVGNFQIAYDSQGLLSASSELYNLDDELEGTVQSLIIDNEYNVDWAEWFNQINTTNFYQTNAVQRPSFAQNGIIQTWNEHNISIYYDKNPCLLLMDNTNNNRQPRTVIGVIKDWDYDLSVSQEGYHAAFVSGSEFDSLQITKQYPNGYLRIIQSSSFAIGNSVSEVPNGIAMFAVGVHNNNIGSGADVRIWLNGNFDTDLSISNIINFTATGLTRLGRAFATGYIYQSRGCFLEYISISGLVSNEDMIAIFENINNTYNIS